MHLALLAVDLPVPVVPACARYACATGRGNLFSTAGVEPRCRTRQCVRHVILRRVYVAPLALRDRALSVVTICSIHLSLTPHLPDIDTVPRHVGTPYTPLPPSVQPCTCAPHWPGPALQTQGLLVCLRPLPPEATRLATSLLGSHRASPSRFHWRLPSLVLEYTTPLVSLVTPTGRSSHSLWHASSSLHLVLRFHVMVQTTWPRLLPQSQPTCGLVLNPLEPIAGVQLISQLAHLRVFRRSEDCKVGSIRHEGNLCEPARITLYMASCCTCGCTAGSLFF